MTQKEAYIEGFCKAAEAYGVDPQELMKVAMKVKLTRGQEKAIDYVLNNLAPTGRGGIGLRVPKIPAPPKGGTWPVKRPRQGFSGADIDAAMEFLGLGGKRPVNPSDILSINPLRIRVPKVKAPPKIK